MHSDWEAKPVQKNWAQNETGSTFKIKKAQSDQGLKRILENTNDDKETKNVNGYWKHKWFLALAL